MAFSLTKTAKRIKSALFGESLATAQFNSRRLSETPGWIFATPNVAGVDVNEDSVMSLSAVFAAVNTLSSIIAALPLSVYKRTPGGSEVAENDPANRLLHIEYNPEMTSFIARRTLEMHRLLWGNNYTEIQWAGNGRPAALWPIEPWRVAPKRDEQGRLYYSIDGGKRKIMPEDMEHETLISVDGIEGQSFIHYACTSLGLAIAAQEFGAAFFANGGMPGGILQHDGATSPEQRAEMRESWERRHSGAKNAHKTAVIWGGWKYIAESGAISPTDAQLIETRRFTTEEVARWLNVPPHIIRDLSRSTNNNIEHQGIEFVINSINPILVLKEQEHNRRLLNWPSTYCKHNVNALLRGDSKARSEFISRMVTSGLMTINEGRALEDMNSIGPNGDVTWMPVNVQTIDRAINPPEPAPTNAPASQQKPAEPPQKVPEQPQQNSMASLREPLRAVLVDTFRRLIKKETNEGRRAAQKPTTFLSWADKFYAGFEATLAEALTPPIHLFNASLGENYHPPEVAKAYCDRSKTELLEMSGKASAARFTQVAEKLYDDWDACRAYNFADILMRSENI